MIRMLRYITQDPQGIKIWILLLGLLGSIFGIITSIISYNPQHTFVQNILPCISLPLGFLCIFYLGMRKNIGNLLGIIANTIEMVVHTAFGNFGLLIMTIYYTITHLFGYINWPKHLDRNNQAAINHIKSMRDLLLLVAMLIFSTLFVLLACYIGLINPQQSLFVFSANIIIMYLGIVAQGVMILRYRYAWYIWFVMNCISIPLHFATGNYVYAVMYILYQLNVIINIYSQHSLRKTDTNR